MLSGKCLSQIVKEEYTMKLSVISYSLTGNNEALARSVAEKYGAEHLKITEKKPRTMSTIVFDLLLNRTPKVQPPPDVLDPFDAVLLFGPIWMGSVATPPARLPGIL